MGDLIPHNMITFLSQDIDGAPATTRSSLRLVSGEQTWLSNLPSSTQAEEIAPFSERSAWSSAS